MDKAGEHHSEVDVTIVEGVLVQPVDQENGEVVVHVQEGYLTPIALHNHEQGVEEVEHLGEVEHMQHNCHARFIGLEGIAAQGQATTSVLLHRGVNRPTEEVHLRCVVNRHRSEDKSEEFPFHTYRLDFTSS